MKRFPFFARTRRVVLSILAKGIEKAARIYKTLCGFARPYTGDWYITPVAGDGLAY